MTMSADQVLMGGGVTVGVWGTKTPSGRDQVELDLGAALALPAALTDPVAAAGRLVAFALGAGGEVTDADEMTLDTRSSKTVRVKK